jgi:hypothetical protein
VASMSLKQNTPTTLIVAWTAPGNQGANPVLGYKLGWTELGPPNRVWDSGPPHYHLAQSPVTLTNLTPNTGRISQNSFNRYSVQAVHPEDFEFGYGA